MVPTLAPPFARVKSNSCALHTTSDDAPGLPMVASAASALTRGSKYLSP
jgi:hypothetical protein